MGVFVGNLIHANFHRELKNRFICEVVLDGRTLECYVPSSCRLSNFFKLDGKNVLIKPTISQGARTQYSLVAIPYKQSFLLLNSSLANQIVAGSINGKRFSFLGMRNQIQKEYQVGDYKADLFITDSRTVIEVKSIISMDKVAIFPTVYSERSIAQLKYLKMLLQNRYKVCYIIVSLNPYISKVILDKKTSLFHHFSECQLLGMMTKAYTCRLKEGFAVIDREICIDTTSSPPLQ